VKNYYRKVIGYSTSKVRAETKHLREQLDAYKSFVDLGAEAHTRFQIERATEEYRQVFEIMEPLVTVCIATYNRSELLVTRSLHSVINQTYHNLEILVIGDCCTDDTAARVQAMSDPRICFFNLPTRYEYPRDPILRWYVAGTLAMNEALMRAKGDLVTHLDDDDEYLPHRVGALVEMIQREKVDLLWHPYFAQDEKFRWRRQECHQFQRDAVTSSCVLYHRWLAQIPWDINAYQYREPGDWNRFRKMKFLGATMMRHPDQLLRHYRERRNKG